MTSIIFSRRRGLVALFAVITLLSVLSCKKEWLDKVPSSGIFVPSTLDDYEKLIAITPSVGSLAISGSDDLSIPQDQQYNMNDIDNGVYSWFQSASFTDDVGSWKDSYNAIYTANVVLDGLNRTGKDPLTQDRWNQAYGSALFIRAYEYYGLAQLYMKAYDPATASSDMGVPLRLTPSVAEIKGRGSVQDVYNQILSDLNTAEPLLFNGPQPYQRFYKPTKAAVRALMARVYLLMGDYKKAKESSDNALQLQHTLLDFNKIQPLGYVGVNMMPYYQNPEVFYPVIGTVFYGSSVRLGWVDSTLYKQFDSNDLRKVFFFNDTYAAPNIIFSGSYSGTSRAATQTAVAVDELYLIRAECAVRTGDVAAGINDLNTLLTSRYKTGTFTPYAANMTPDDALKLVLTERRKELLFRSTRWEDLRRLNKDPRFQTTITHTLASDGQTYPLLPNSNRYVWPIPAAEINISGIPQNPQ